MNTLLFNFLIILVITFASNFSLSSAKLNNDDTPVDFWTNSFSEIMLQFRFNKDTNKLEMHQGVENDIDDEEGLPRDTRRADVEVLDKDSQATNCKGQRKRKSKSRPRSNILVIEDNAMDNEEKTFSTTIEIFTTEAGATEIMATSSENPLAEDLVTALAEENHKSPSKPEKVENTSIVSTSSRPLIDVNIDLGTSEGTTITSVTAADSDSAETETPRNARPQLRMKSKAKPDPRPNTSPNPQSTTNANSAKQPSTPNPISGDPCSMHCPNETHIACGNNWELSPKCSPNARVLILDEQKQKHLLELHNNLRNKLAGKSTRFESAARMATMQWHQELADYALLNAMRCEEKHDHCHTTRDFLRPGQNLAWRKGSVRLNVTIETVMERMVNAWYGEEQYAQQSDLDDYKGNGLNDEVIAHFTNIVNERNTHMGCGAVLAEDERIASLYLACNYARANIFNVPIYQKGPAGSLCESGLDSNYKNLCSIREVYDYNN